MSISDFLRQNELRLFHAGHGQYDAEWPVLFAEMDRLDREFDVAAVVEVHTTR